MNDSTPLFWHVLTSATVLVLAGLITGWTARRYTPRERILLGVALLAHTGASFALLLIYKEFYGYGDILTYFREGNLISRYVESGAPGATDALFDLILQGDPHFPFMIHGIGSSTGSMAGLGALLLMATGSIWSGNLLIAMLAFLGQLGLYATARKQFAETYRVRLAIACLLVPSATLWGSGLLKEAPIFGGLGLSALGLHRLSQRKLSGLVVTVIGLSVIALSKPYVLWPLAFGSAAWLYWRAGARRTGRSFQPRPLRLVGVVFLAVSAVVLIGTFFPTFSIENIAESVEQEQYNTLRAAGGSTYQLAEGGVSRGPLEQLLYAPLALLTAWFRPTLLEVGNVLMLVNAAESTVVLGLALRVVFLKGIRGIWSALRQSPALAFCLAFAVLMGVGVGLATTNLGTLSRYRAPLMPFLVLLLLVLDASKSRRPPRQPLATSAKTRSQ